MKFLTPLYGQELVNQLRACANTVRKRLWICVPYLGGSMAMRRILGRQWLDNTSISIRLLTDTEELNHFNGDSIRIIHQRGSIKHLPGVHAKIFILDDICLITSANLTNKAFTKRHEIGIFLNGKQAKQAINIFEKWWQKAGSVSVQNIEKLLSRRRPSEEETSGPILPNLWTLPDDPGRNETEVERRFLRYHDLLETYQLFAAEYKVVQRLWPRSPLFFETDCFLNYLFHDAPDKPSNAFQDRRHRQLTTRQRRLQLIHYAREFEEAIDRDAMRRYKNSSAIINGLLNPHAVIRLRRSGVWDIMNQLNCLNSRPGNKDRIVEQNSLQELRHGFNSLVNGSQRLAARMTVCGRLHGVGPSTMNEILGFAYPRIYPLLNLNSESGLRFFGYPT